MQLICREMVASSFELFELFVGCPKIVNVGTAKTDMFYEQKKYGFKKR